MSESPADDPSPDGDDIEVHTLWLDFADEGEVAISIDLTKFNAALKRAARRL